MAPQMTLWIDWRAADAEQSETYRETLTETLFRELNGFDEVEHAYRVPDPAVPDGGMGAAWLWGVLKTEVSLANLGKLIQAIQERLPGKPVSFEVEVEGKRIQMTNAPAPQDFEAAVAALVAAAEKLAKT